MPPDDAVTTERAWRSWADAGKLEAPDWGPPGRAVVVAPSYTDAVLAAGGTLCRLDGEGWRLTILVVTGRVGGAAADSLLVAGQVELVGEADGSRALRRLGITGAPVCHLHLPSAGPVPDPDHLVRLLAYELVGATWCIAPFVGEAAHGRASVGSAALRAAAGAGVGVAAYPLDLWSWATPGEGDVPWRTARAERLDRAAQDRKAAAVAELATAAVAVGAGAVTANAAASRPWELFFVGPDAG